MISEFDSVVWDRVEQGLPVLLAGDGIGLWQATHRSDVGRLFAHAAGNPKTYAESFNATRDHVFTWRDYYREAAQALETRAQVVLAPAGWVIAQNPKRFSFLEEITRTRRTTLPKSHDGPRFSGQSASSRRADISDMRTRSASPSRRPETPAGDARSIIALKPSPMRGVRLSPY